MPSVLPESLLPVAVPQGDPVPFIKAEEIVVPPILVPEDNAIKIFPA